MAIRDAPWRCVFLLFFFLRWEFSIKRLELLGWRSIFLWFNHLKDLKIFASFVELGQEQKPLLTHFPTLHEAGVPKTRCASSHPTIASDLLVPGWYQERTWFHPENAWTNTGHAVGPTCIFAFKNFGRFCWLQNKSLRKKCLHQPICKKPQSELVWCTEASTMPSLMRVTMMRFVSPKGKWEGHFWLIFCKQSQDARHDDDSPRWNQMCAGDNYDYPPGNYITYPRQKVHLKMIFLAQWWDMKSFPRSRMAWCFWRNWLSYPQAVCALVTPIRNR